MGWGNGNNNYFLIILFIYIYIYMFVINNTLICKYYIVKFIVTLASLTQ